MSKKTYVVTLTEQEKEALLALIDGGEAKACKLRRAHILLLADEGNTDVLIARLCIVDEQPSSALRQAICKGI